MELSCDLCPRRCGAARSDEAPAGVCRSPLLPRIARAAAHFGEEPCICGSGGAGAIFFTGCNLRCVFCQNREISRGEGGQSVSVPRLREIMLRLRDEGVHNINLVTPTHYARVIAAALDGLELGIPVGWNSSGYESVETLRRLEGLVQVYMPDYKYALPELAGRCSGAPDYPETARAALREMYRQAGPFKLDENGLLCRGVLVRHLVLPGQVENSLRVLDWIGETFAPGQVLVSLMRQYTPMGGLGAPYDRRVTEAEYEAVLSWMYLNRLEGFTQEAESADAGFIPDFQG